LKPIRLLLIPAISLSLTTACISPSLLAFAAETNKPPVYTSRQTIPDAFKWRLTDLYSKPADFESDIQAVEKKVNQLAAYQGKLGLSRHSLKEALDHYIHIMRLQEKIGVYAQLALDVDKSNPSAQIRANQAAHTGTLIQEKTAWLVPEIISLKESYMQKCLTDNRLSLYKNFLQEIRKAKAHTLSKEMEKLMAGSAPLASVPEDTYSMLAKDLKLPLIQDGRGKLVQLTSSNYSRFMESRDRETRKRAYLAYSKTLEGYQDTFAQLLAGEVKAHDYFSKARNYPSSLEASLLPNDIPPKVYDELIQTVHKNLPLLHRYMALKKRLLGVQELHSYDLYAPVVSGGKDYIPYEEGKKMVLDGLAQLGEDYVRLLNKAFSEGWIDVYPTPGKRSGGYQIGTYDAHPFVLLNYEGTYDDVSTIAHELGHAMQTYYTNQKQPFISSNYPIFTAEVASTLNETLLYKSLYAKAKARQEKIDLLNQYLERFRSTLFTQTMFAEFEKEIHKREQSGQPLVADTLNKLYLELNNQYNGPSMITDPESAYGWARIPHFYYNFYVYQYATSFAASTALANQIAEEGKPAVDRIKTNFLSAGSSKPPLEVLKSAGVDMTTSKPVEQAMVEFKKALDELDNLLNEK
jgi:oligoendopeptidase F